VRSCGRQTLPNALSGQPKALVSCHLLHGSSCHSNFDSFIIVTKTSDCSGRRSCCRRFNCKVLHLEIGRLLFSLRSQRLMHQCSFSMQVCIWVSSRPAPRCGVPSTCQPCIVAMILVFSQLAQSFSAHVHEIQRADRSKCPTDMDPSTSFNSQQRWTLPQVNQQFHSLIFQRDSSGAHANL